MKYRLSTPFEEKYDFFSNEGRDISLPPLPDLLPCVSSNETNEIIANARGD